MESKHVELGPAVPWGNSSTMVVTPFQQVSSLLNFHLSLYVVSVLIQSLLVTTSNLTYILLSFCLSCKLLRPQNGGIPSLAALPMSNCIQVGRPPTEYALAHSFLSLFYCAHWQTYVSGTLQFGYIDVTEGQIVVMGVMLISSLEDFLDIDIWMSSVSTWINMLT